MADKPVSPVAGAIAYKVKDGIFVECPVCEEQNHFPGRDELSSFVCHCGKFVEISQNVVTKPTNVSF